LLGPGEFSELAPPLVYATSTLQCHILSMAYVRTTAYMYTDRRPCLWAYVSASVEKPSRRSLQ